MPDPEENGLLKCVESLLADKAAMAAREKKLIQDLSVGLQKMGYRVVPIKNAGGAGSASTGKKRGRPPGSGKAQATKPPTTT
jgi:hypothetical protein